MLVESSFNWIRKDCGFNTKTYSWCEKILINLNVHGEWYKIIEIIR